MEEVKQKYRDDFDAVYSTCAYILSKPIDLLKEIFYTNPSQDDE